MDLRNQKYNFMNERFKKVPILLIQRVGSLQNGFF